MLRLLGTILVIGACSALGFSARQRLAQRVRALDQMIRALDQMAAELGERQTPLPEIIAKLKEEGGADSRCFFAEVYRRLERADGFSFAYCWQTTARDLALELGIEAEETVLLRDAAAYLGRYQVEQQLLGLRQTRERLESIRIRSCDELRTKGGVYRTCGIAAGIVTVLMML